MNRIALAGFAIAAVVLISADSPEAPKPRGAANEEKKPPKEISVDLGKGVKLEMVLIPAGEFMMGLPKSDRHAVENSPEHRVRISFPFYVGKYPVTQEQWEAVMGDNPSTFKGSKNPVENVTWYGCHEFLKRLNGKVGGERFQLPTEAQWEYACRAGSKTRYCFGDDEKKLGEYGWLHDNSRGHTHPVGMKKPNVWGLFDMHGNVNEICADFYNRFDYYAKSPPVDPMGPPDGMGQAVRGGGWYSTPWDCGSASRGYDFGGKGVLGFRVCRLVPGREISVDLGRGVKLEMVLVPAGEFMMGSPGSETYIVPDEKPQHRVRITKPFYLGKYTVTQEQWEAVTGNNPSQFKGATNPVENVSWNECQDFLKKLNARVSGEKFQLPTEAQWEYACRAGSNRRYSFGGDQDKLKDYAWYRNNSDEHTHPVGKKKPNVWGLYDIHGNVSQLCADWYDANYYSESPTDDPTGPKMGWEHVVRGGSYLGLDSYCRSPSRSYMTALRHNSVGLRVLRLAADKKTEAQ